MTPFKVISADPAWAFDDKLPDVRGADSHYSTMRWQDICLLKLPPIADDAILFLWRVAAMQEEAMAVMHMWGFDGPKSELVWVKTKSGLLFPDGDELPDVNDLAFGMGRSVRNCHEVCLIGTRGKYTKLIKNHSLRSVLFAPRGKHSEKPEEFFTLVEKLTDGEGPYLELFSRRRRAGWITIGDELGTKLETVCHSQEEHTNESGGSTEAPARARKTRRGRGVRADQGGGAPGAQGEASVSGEADG